MLQHINMFLYIVNFCKEFITLMFQAPTKFGKRLDAVARLVSFANNKDKDITPADDNASNSSNGSNGSTKTVINITAQVHNSDLMGHTTINN